MSEDNYRRKKIAEKKNENVDDRHSSFARKLMTFVIIAGLILVIASIISLKSRNAEKARKYNQIQAQIEELKIKNEELTLTLNSDDIGEYIEKLAIEKYGYAYADEIRFYDTSHN
jgi:cell division protein FtsB